MVNEYELGLLMPPKGVNW